MNDAWSQEYSPELARLVAQAAARVPAPGLFPPPRPGPGQSMSAWRDEVAIIRARHDAAALTAGSLAAALLPAWPQAWTEVDSTWTSIPVDGGAIGARVYTPAGTGPFPAVILIHGGGYWMGGGATGFHLNDALCRQICAETRAVTLNVDHRLAPEDPFPTPVEDALAALVWLADNAARFEVDPDQIAFFGISSGGNLACAAAQESVKRGGPAVAGQVLQCPSLDLSFGSGRLKGLPGEVKGARALVEMYAGSAPLDTAGLSPGLSPDLDGTAPSLIIVAEFDPLRDAAVAYAARLETAGRSVTLHRYPMTHTVATPDVFLAMHQASMGWLRALFGRG